MGGEPLNVLWQYVSQVNADLDDCGFFGEGVTKEAILRSFDSLDQHFVYFIRGPMISK